MMFQRTQIQTGLLCCLLLTTPAIAAVTADGEAKPRPRVGLVLSGGGARGGAHIGVLQVLEEMRVPIDYVAGTSMGATAGGLYASGMSPDEIIGELEGINWEAVLDDREERKDRSFRRKGDDRLLPIKAKPGVDLLDAELKLPAGLIQGQKIGLLLRDWTLPVAGVSDFDQLPIPFRAVTTDIGTGTTYVIGSGNLADAMRASMSVPGAIAPLKLDGRLLVDGGVTNNLPINVARGMGAEVLIVVDISTPMRDAAEVDSLLAITDQLINIMTRGNTEAQLASLGPGDIQILPNLGDITTTDFARTIEAVPAGYAAAAALRDRLKSLSVSEVEYQAWLAARARRPAGPPIIEFIRVENNAGLDPDLLSGMIRQPVGEPLDAARLDRDVGRIYGLDVFEKVSYEIVDEAGRSGVLVQAQAKPWGPDYLQFGLALEDDFSGDNQYNLRVAYLKTGLNRLGAEWRSFGGIGQDPGLGTEWYQPLDRDLRYFINPSAAFGKSSINIFDGNDDDDKIGEYRLTNWQLELAGGREISTFGEIRLGYTRRWINASRRVGDPTTLPTQDFNSGSVFLQLSVDRLNSVNFPTRGYSGVARYTMYRSELGDDSGFDQLRISARRAFTWGRNTLLPRARFEQTVRGDPPIYALYRGGGFLNLSGFENNALSGETFALGEIIYYRRINDSALLPVYLGGSIEYGDATDDLDLTNMRAAGSLFLGVDSFIGPLYLGAGAAEGGHSSAYLILGQPF
ncbi:MAG: patatin-like phospholipase family protein [Gammaproteobacteria bacterium]